MKKNIVFLAAFLGLVIKAQAGVNPSSLPLKIFEIRFSTSSDCSSSVSVFKVAAGETEDFASNPALGKRGNPDRNVSLRRGSFQRRHLLRACHQ